MSRRRIMSAGLLAPLVASLLILGIFAAELPELVSLVDDTSNDFVVRKATHGENPSTTTAPSHGLLTFEAKYFGGDARHECADGFIAVAVGSSELFLLNSVLRR
jgi:hypothetical protein